MLYYVASYLYFLIKQPFMVFPYIERIIRILLPIGVGELKVNVTD